MRSPEHVAALVAARVDLSRAVALPAPEPLEAEGGCGVVGLASTRPIAARHMHTALVQMHNRGNGKGGGIAAVGLDPRDMGVSQDVLDRDYLLLVAYLDPRVRGEVEKEFVEEVFEVDESRELDSLGDVRAVPGLEVCPPQVWRYFVRPRTDRLDRFTAQKGLADLPRADVEDELVYQNSFLLNAKYYTSLGEKRAFVLSHGRDMMILKIVGYAESVLDYYKIRDLRARVWVGHQRYPTKGRVWHPGGAHPFIGLHDALVHNGDFANYHSICEYLAQRNLRPLFLTDTEVAVLLFDLYQRTYGYPLEYTIEALAPTTERDFTMLSPERQEVYRDIQACHVHGSPDGPWFFIIARNDLKAGEWQLLGITDTSMLRPQVFALQRGTESIGLIASEKQAIDATLASIAAEDPDFLPVADLYWNARGGSYTDGGSFLFGITRDGGRARLSARDKFGAEIDAQMGAGGRGGASTDSVIDVSGAAHAPAAAQTAAEAATAAKTATASARPEDSAPTSSPDALAERVAAALASGGSAAAFDCVTGVLTATCGDPARDREMLLAAALARLSAMASHAQLAPAALETLTRLNDRRFDLAGFRRALLLTHAHHAIDAFLDGVPPVGARSAVPYRRVDRQGLAALDTHPHCDGMTLVIDVSGLPPEGEDGASPAIVRAVRHGWSHLILHRAVGQRFFGCGLGADTHGVTIDVHGSSGDYLASGLDGGVIIVHGSAQDQVGQILKAGTLVVHGDVGQTFLYGAKGGDVFVRGNAAGRPLINAVGRPRVVINGTCLDYLAESFMAGDPLQGGGFVVVNGVRETVRGTVEELPAPYAGGNLFSLASGGAIYLRDPHRRVGEEQLNGGQFTDVSDEDWAIVEPYLRRNEEFLGIRLGDLLTVSGRRQSPAAVYRKVRAVPLKALQPTGI